MNIIINQVCNRACPYCFAKGMLQPAEGDNGAEPPGTMPAANFAQCVEFARRSGIRSVQILGGEPTLHPHFLDFTRMAAEAGLAIKIFSNGIWSDRFRTQFEEQLKQWPIEQVTFVFNVNEPGEEAPGARARQERSMAAVGPRGTCGFTIYREDFDLRFVAPLTETCGLSPNIRVGLACPIVGEKNEFMDLAALKRVGHSLAQQARDLQARGITLYLDCGFQMCMFDDTDLGAMIRLTNFTPPLRCPFPIDIGPDLTLWPCFPLRGLLDAHLSDYSTYQELAGDFIARLTPLQRLGSRPECADCRYLETGQCVGGCIAYRARQMEELA